MGLASSWHPRHGAGRLGRPACPADHHDPANRTPGAIWGDPKDRQRAEPLRDFIPLKGCAPYVFGQPEAFPAGRGDDPGLDEAVGLDRLGVPERIER